MVERLLAKGKVKISIGLNHADSDFQTQRAIMETLGVEVTL